MAKTAINLYSVRDLDEPLLDVLDRVADAGYDGVQISGGVREDSENAAEAVREKLDETGLEPTGPHVTADALEDDRENVVRTYRDVIGCESMVISGLGSDNFASAETVEATADRLGAIAEDLAADDLPLHYHNHDHEFVEFDGTSGLERILETTDRVGAELDVGWALVGGRDPAEFIRRHGDRIDLVHMKDMDVENREFREIGEGDVDMQACADAAREVDATWLIYEHDFPENPAESIETGARVLNSL